MNQETENSSLITDLFFKILLKIIGITAVVFLLIFIFWILIPTFTKSSAGMQETVRIFCKCENFGNNFIEFKKNCKEYISDDASQFLNRVDTYTDIIDDESESIISKIIISVDGAFTLRKYQMHLKSYCPTKYDTIFGEFASRISYLGIALWIIFVIFCYSVPSVLVDTFLKKRKSY